MYAVAGFVLGVLAPVFWTLLRLILFYDAEVPIITQIFSDVTESAYNMALYAYMGIGTAMVMSFLGFFIGKGADELDARASELNNLHREVATQKEIFENRYVVLDNNIKNFHQISHRIQKSTDAREVLRLCAEGLHEVLGYERVNILLADEERKHLSFIAATGSAGFDPTNVSMPIDSRLGIIYKAFIEKKLYLVDDIGKYSADYYLQPPFDEIKPLRSRSFVLCPIVVRGQSVGIFGIDNRFTARSLNDTDVDTVKLFADQAALAITRINLLNAINTLINELETTFSSLLNKREAYSRNVFNLKTAINSLADGTSNIASASESVMSSVDDTSSSVTRISVAIDQVTRNLDYLADNVDKSVSAMEEINATIKNVERSSAISHQVSAEVRLQAETGSDVVRQTIASLAEIQNSVDLSFDSIKRLVENSSRIDGIIEVINEITKRTNLLALNASIIAAQAGEYGRSFGVVADEIRNLSLQTGRSTEEITGIIEEIMHDSRHAADNISSTKNFVAKGVTLGQQTGSALQVILDSSLRAMEMTEEIKLATEEQAKSVQLITQSIEDVSSMTSQIFNASKEQANATRTIVRSVDSIKEMSQQMVNATGRQVSDGNEIKTSVEDVSRMVIEIFENIEMRRKQSLAVITEMETMKEVTG